MIEVDDENAYLDESASAGRMGKAVEYLVAAACILSTRGELNVSTSMVDDEGLTSCSTAATTQRRWRSRSRPG